MKLRTYAILFGILFSALAFLGAQDFMQFRADLIVNSLSPTPLTNAEEGALSLDASNEGLIVYNSDTSSHRYWDGAAFQEIDTASSFWSESGGNIYRSTGYVGIGDTTPDSVLDVESDDLSPIFNTTSATNDRMAFIFQSGGTQTGRMGVDISGSNDDDLQFLAGSGSTPMMHIEADGFIGVNTTSPDTRLDVNGAVTIRELSADPANPDEGATAIWQSDGTGSGSDGDVMAITTSGAVTVTYSLTPAFATMSVENNAGAEVISASSTDWSDAIKITAWDTTQSAFLVTADPTTDDDFEIVRDGDYEQTLSISFSNGSSDTISLAFFKNSGKSGTVATWDDANEEIDDVAHGLSTNDQIVFTGTVPVELTAGVTYYVIYVSDDIFQVEATIGGGAIAFSAAAGGATWASNGTQLGSRMTRKLGTGGDVGAGFHVNTTSGLVQGDTIAVFVQNETAPDNIVVEDASFTIKRLR